MSRTHKGSKAPGWEPWSNRNERQQPAPDYSDYGDEKYETFYSQWMEERVSMDCFLYGPCEKCKALLHKDEI